MAFCFTSVRKFWSYLKLYRLHVVTVRLLKVRRLHRISRERVRKQQYILRVIDSLDCPSQVYHVHCWVSRMPDVLDGPYLSELVLRTGQRKFPRHFALEERQLPK